MWTEAVDAVINMENGLSAHYGHEDCIVVVVVELFSLMQALGVYHLKWANKIILMKY